MKILGIDYGKKRVGVAIGDTETLMAFPKIVLDNSKNFFDDLKKICSDEKIEKIILGESKNFKGEDNLIMEEIKNFKSNLEKEGFEVAFHPEFLTSAQAERLQGKNEMLDASAAAIILQSYLDKA